MRENNDNDNNDNNNNKINLLLHLSSFAGLCAGLVKRKRPMMTDKGNHQSARERGNT